jgi:phosphoglucosamine mutase
MKIVVDCANGAAYNIAPSVFAELGAEVVPIAVDPDGLNINLGCGSTDPRQLRSTVIEHGADLGVAFDGDADRVVMVDSDGTVLNGDELLYIIARDRLRGGHLPGNGVVGTLMSNLGLEVALSEIGVNLHRAAVGDRHVLQLMTELGVTLGGEGSGHIICLDRTTTGDGIVSALQVLSAVADTESTLTELAAGMSQFPQRLVNVPVIKKLDPTQSPPIQDAIQEIEASLGHTGRVLLRPSGTEPVIRVMVEGEDARQVANFAQELATVVERAMA